MKNPNNLNLITPFKGASSGVAFADTKSVLFGGTDEYLEGSDFLGFNVTDSFSFSVWVKSSSISSLQVFLSKRSDTSPLQGYALFFFNSRFRFSISGFQAPSTSGDLVIEYPTILSNDTWYHFVITYDGSATVGGTTMYVNGSSVGTNTIANTLNTSMSIDDTDDFTIGADSNGSPPIRYLLGNLDDVSIWNKELNSSEVTAIYNSGSPDDLREKGFYNTSDCLAWYWLGDYPDDSTDTAGIIHDATENGHDVTAFNMEAGDIVNDVP